MALEPRRRARGLLAYLRSERRTLRQGFAALVLGTVTAFIAGVTLASIADTLEMLPGLLILIPAVLGMRGTIFGAIGARLGTSTHAGLFEATLARTGVLYQNVYVGVVMTLTSSLWLAALAKIAAGAFGLRSISLLDFVVISVIGGVVDSAFILMITVGLSVLSYRRGYDLDAVATPLITAMADMLTVPALFAATFLIRVGWLRTSLAAVAILACVYAGIRGALTDLRMARRILLEMVAVVLLTPLLDILAGAALEPRLEGFARFPSLLVLVPPFVATAGALGGILSSRLSSKLQLGILTPRGLPESPALLDAGLVLGFGTVIFTFMGGLGLAYATLFPGGSPGATALVAGTLIAGMLTTLVAVPCAYYIAVLTTRFGLDPDNHSVPIITSVMDLTGVLAFLAVLSLFGVATHA
ncbi:MAG: magnesium transporter [Actinobacteria bacterium]|nr:magnesium transporter [Actinomycetota bacterium]